MTTIDCPLCDQPVELDLAASAAFACDGCRVHAELAPDPLPALAAVAA